MRRVKTKDIPIAIGSKKKKVRKPGLFPSWEGLGVGFSKRRN
jgi:hypothetical protein